MSRFKLALIIDDNEMDLFVINTILQRVQLAEKVLTISGTYKALEQIQLLNSKIKAGKLQPEEICIFLDLMMPFMNGNDFIESLAKINSSLISQVFILSNLPLDEQVEYIKTEGVAGFIAKPLRDEKIQEMFFSNQLNPVEVQ